LVSSGREKYWRRYAGTSSLSYRKEAESRSKESEPIAKEEEKRKKILKIRHNRGKPPLHREPRRERDAVKEYLKE